MMLVFSRNGGSTAVVLPRQSQKPVVIQGASGGARLLTVTVLDIDGAEVTLQLDLDIEIPTDPSEAPKRVHVASGPESKRDASYRGGERMQLTEGGGTQATEKQYVN